MDKEIFVKRLSEINVLIESKKVFIETKNKEAQQANADLNVLLGCKAECEFWTNKYNQFVETNKKDFVTLEELKEMTGASEIDVHNVE
jgi:hypothetical protein